MEGEPTEHVLQAEGPTEGAGTEAAAHPPDAETMLEFMGAGVLPWSRGEDGSIIFFFGKELSRGCTLAGKSKYVWSDFGGKREGLHEEACDTASREFSEETLGLFGGMGGLRERIESSTALTRSLISARGAPGCFTLKNGLYINYVLELQYIDPLMFQLARDANDLNLANGGIKEGGEDDDSDPMRAAEKRDWAWVDSQELLLRMEGGSCRVRSVEGQRLHLLPRLAVTLRTYLRKLLSHIESCTPIVELLVVRLQTASRCLHLFGVRDGIDEQGLRERLGMVESVTAYKDRTKQRNVFILFGTAAEATRAMATLKASPTRALVWEDASLTCAVEYAWFEDVLEDTRESGSKVHDRRKHASRLRKLGVGPSTAPWAKKKPRV